MLFRSPEFSRRKSRKQGVVFDVGCRYDHMSRFRELKQNPLKSCQPRRIQVLDHFDNGRCVIAFEPLVAIHERPLNHFDTGALFPTLPAGKLRHRDHRFEWTRSEFDAWANRIASRYGYAVRIQPVGPVDETWGAPTQMGIFERAGEQA